LAWIEVHQALFTHRKTLELAELLALPEVYASAHLIALWTWALDNAPTSCLPKSARIIAKAAQYPGDAQAFIEACVKVGFIDEVADGWLIHDWDEYAGKLLYQRDRNRAKQQAWRERQQNGDVTDEPSLLDGDVTVTLPLRNRAPNPTQPNPTIQKDIVVTSDAQQTSPQKKQRATPFPEQFLISQEDKEWASEHVPGLDLKVATREWALSMRANTTRYRYTDWHLAWRKAMSNALKWGEGNNARGGTNNPASRGPTPPPLNQW
jgi:hypothetical protein